MNPMLKNIAGSLVTAAIIALVGLLWQFNARLASVETKLDFLTHKQTTQLTAKKI